MSWAKACRNLVRYAFRIEKKFNMLIFFVTSRCNSACRSCFYWRSLNREGDLTLTEIEKLTSLMPRFRDLWLSGGEPILRHDLAEIVKLFYDNNGVRSINLPTNGLLPGKTANTVDRILTENPDLGLHVNVALDGFPETHDRIRGVRGGFQRTLESLGYLSQLRGKHIQLKVFVNSTICTENYRELIDLGQYVLDEFDLDGHYFQIIRGDVMDGTLKVIPRKVLEEFYGRAAKAYWKYLSRWSENQGGLPERLRRCLYMGAYLFCFRTQWENYVAGKEWGMECTAGVTSAVIDYNGDLRICELRKPIGNLRECDLEFPRLWWSREREREVERMKQDRCFCTHVCFIYDSLRYSRKAKLFGLPLGFLKYKSPAVRLRGL